MDKREAIAAELPRLRRYARALTRDRLNADDLVQDCVERALSKLHLFRAGTNMRAWLFTILHNLHVNNMRRQNRAVDSSELKPEHENRHAMAPDQGFGLVLRDVSHALAQLPMEQREMVLLIGLEEMSYKEAAEITGAPIGTVMSRLSRGREHLRTLMETGETATIRRVK